MTRAQWTNTDLGRFCCSTLRRSSPSEKLTPSRDTECPFMPFAEIESVDLFCNGAEMYKRNGEEYFTDTQ